MTNTYMYSRFRCRRSGAMIEGNGELLMLNNLGGQLAIRCGSGGGEGGGDGRGKEVKMKLTLK